MANKVLLKKSSITAKIPTIDDLDYGELAINYADGKLYFKKSNNTIDSFASSTASSTVSSVDGNVGDITATQLLTAIKKVDGSGSGLDADLLDGLTGTDYARSGNNTDIVSLTPDYIDFDTNVTITPQEGRIFWDNVDGAKTLSIGMADGVTQQVGQETYFRVKATAPITNGQVVMATGTQGASGVVTAAPATGLTPETGVYVIGIATQDIALNSWGYVTSFGLVRGINTTGGAEAWTDGTVLYYNPAVPGGLTKTKPTAPNAIVLMAMVVYAASNGSLFVRPSYGSVLGGTDGNVQFGTLADKELIVYNGTTQRWENSSNITINNLTHSGLVPSDGTNIDQVKTITKALTLSTDWQDTGISSTDLATGSYMLQLYANDLGSGGTNNNEYYTGVMSWYSGDTNSALEMPTDEIVLHRAGASGDGALYLRTYRTPTADASNLKLQIYSNTANASAANYVFKFRRMM